MEFKIQKLRFENDTKILLNYLTKFKNKYKLLKKKPTLVEYNQLENNI